MGHMRRAGVSCPHADPRSSSLSGTRSKSCEIITASRVEGSADRMSTSETMLRELAPNIRTAIRARWRGLSLGRDQLIFMEGEPCRSLYILETGKVKCYRANAAGREQILKVFAPRGVRAIALHFASFQNVKTSTRLPFHKDQLIASEAQTSPAGTNRRAYIWSELPKHRLRRTHPVRRSLNS